MDEKKQLIVDTAAAMFLEKGFQQTSTQEIAEACNMSKTTLYKYFPSKEELGLQVAYHLSWGLLYAIEKCQNRADLTPQQKLKEAVILRLERFREKHRFMDVLYFAFSLEQKQTYMPTIYKLKYQVFEAFLQLITAAYRLDNEPMAWELNLAMTGMVKEVSFLQNQNGVQITPEGAADYIIDSLAAIAKARRGRPPLLDDLQLANIKPAFMKEQAAFFPIIRRNQILQALRDKSADLPSPDRENCLEVAAQLETEYQKSLPKPAVAEAFLTYLAQWPQLLEPVQMLRELRPETNPAYLSCKPDCNNK